MNETSLGAVGLEYLMQGQTPISFFANGRFGENDYQQVSAGLTVYLDAGPAMSLIDRHRMQDPSDCVPTVGDGLYDIVTAGGPPDRACPDGTSNSGESPTNLFDDGDYYCSPDLF